MSEPRIPARESSRLLLVQACKPAGRGVGDGQVKKKDRIKWSERTSKHVPASDVDVTYRKPEFASRRSALAGALRTWKENA